jgi:hypothetical protein
MKKYGYLLIRPAYRIYIILHKDMFILDDEVLDNTDNGIDKLTLNYQEMDETVKEKLREVMEKFHEINNTANS